MITTLELSNVTVFNNARLDFSPGLNVLIGENGTGKSHVLKLGYALLQTVDVFKNTISSNVPSFVRILVTHERLASIFGCNSALLSRNNHAEEPFALAITLSDGCRYAIDEDMADVEYQPGSATTLSTLFIPPKEILSVYKGFRSTLKTRELAFDGTYLDLAEALDLPPFKDEMLGAVRPLYEPLEQILHARIEQENGEFFFTPQEGDADARIHAQLAAEGHRKLGMLSYLIKNGSLREGTSLFWDEPEANLNPRLLVKLARVLVELSRHMQIIIATHSLFLLRELEILQETQNLRHARYFGLHFAADGGVEIQQGNSSSDIGDIAALEASLDQSDRYMNLSYGDA